MVQALNSSKYDLNKTALVISQTGGGCRATNYIAFLRKALKDANMEHIPVISLMQEVSKHEDSFNFSSKQICNGYDIWRSSYESFI